MGEFPRPKGLIQRVHTLFVLVLPCLVVVALVVERNPLGFEASNLSFLGDNKLDYPSAEVGLYFQLPHERCLVFCRSALNNVDFTGVAVLGLVVMSNQKDVGLLATLI